MEEFLKCRNKSLEYKDPADIPAIDAAMRRGCIIISALVDKCNGKEGSHHSLWRLDPQFRAEVLKASNEIGRVVRDIAHAVQPTNELLITQWVLIASDFLAGWIIECKDATHFVPQGDFLPHLCANVLIAAACTP